MTGRSAKDLADQLKELNELLEEARNFFLDKQNDVAELEVLAGALADTAAALLPEAPDEASRRDPDAGPFAGKRAPEDLLSAFEELQQTIEEASYTDDWEFAGTSDEAREVLEKFVEVVERMSKEVRGGD